MVIDSLLRFGCAKQGLKREVFCNKLKKLFITIFFFDPSLPITLTYRHDGRNYSFHFGLCGWAWHLEVTEKGAARRWSLWILNAIGSPNKSQTAYLLPFVYERNKFKESLLFPVSAWVNHSPFVGHLQAVAVSGRPCERRLYFILLILCGRDYGTG